MSEDDAIYILKRYAEGREAHTDRAQCPTLMEFARRNNLCPVCQAIAVFDRDNGD